MFLLKIHIDLITCKYTCIYIYTHMYIYISLSLYDSMCKNHIYIYISVRYRTKQLESWQLQLDDLIPPTDFSFYKSTSVLLNLRLDADNLSNLQLANLKLPINSAFYQQNQVNSLAFRAAWIVTLSVRLISRTTLSNRQLKKNTKKRHRTCCSRSKKASSKKVGICWHQTTSKPTSFSLW